MRMDTTCSNPHTADNRNIIGIEVQGVYDGILVWQCPYCAAMWPRFPDGTWKWSKGLDYIDTVTKERHAQEET